MKPNALEADRSRALSTFEEVWAAYEAKVTVDTWDYTAKPVPGGRRGHYFVYTPELVKQMVEAVDGDWWELVAEEAVDSKVGNSFTLAFKLDKPAKGDPRLYVADDEQERFDTKHDAEVVADGGEVAKIGEEARPLEGLEVLNPGLNALGGLATPGAITGTVTGNRKPAAKKRTPKKKS